MSQPPAYPAPKFHRPSTPVFAAFGLMAALAAGLGLHALARGPAEARRIAGEADLVARLGLSDLALFTEARYTRHPSLADLATPFQDSPASFEHFPSGSFVSPPAGGWGQEALSFNPAELTQ